MRIFIAGIMQGSHTEAVLHDQDYREHFRELLQSHLPNAEVYDPLADHADSIDYEDDHGRDVFFGHNKMCRDVDLLVAFVPQASMGTAIEMWEAYQHEAVVVTISPMQHNWTIKFLSHILYEDVAEFKSELASGRLARRVAEIRAK